MHTFLRKTRSLWRKSIISPSVETAVVAPNVSSPIRTPVETMSEALVQTEVALMSLPYELLIHIMESVPILYRSMTLSSFRLTNRRYSDLVGAYLFKHVVLKVDPARLGEFLDLVDANPRLAEYCRTLELWLDRFAVRASEVDTVQSRIIRRLPHVQKLILNSAVTALRNRDGSVRPVTRSPTGLPLDETLSAMRAATWITGPVLAPCYDQHWTIQVFNVFSSHITHLTLSVKEPILLIGFPKCPQLRHVELPYPVLRDAAELLPVLSQSPNLRHLSVSHLKVDAKKSRGPNKTKPPISYRPLDSLRLAYIGDTKFLRALASVVPTRALTILFESENHALDLRNIMGALFSDSNMRRESGHLKVLHLERSRRKIERSTIDERNVALEMLKGYCIRSNIELKYDFPPEEALALPTTFISSTI